MLNRSDLAPIEPHLMGAPHLSHALGRHHNSPRQQSLDSQEKCETERKGDQEDSQRAKLGGIIRRGEDHRVNHDSKSENRQNEREPNLSPESWVVLKLNWISCHGCVSAPSTGRISMASTSREGGL